VHYQPSAEERKELMAHTAIGGILVFTASEEENPLEQTFLVHRNDGLARGYLIRYESPHTAQRISPEELDLMLKIYEGSITPFS